MTNKLAEILGKQLDNGRISEQDNGRKYKRGRRSDNVARFHAPPDMPQPERTVVVLSVSSLEETHSRLRGIFQHTRWRIHEAWQCREAVEWLRSQPVAVVICERRLSDGTWTDLLEQLASLPVPPTLVVTSWDADDRLWGEVLNLGGYDVLAKPFDPSEVTRVVSLAWLYWKERLRRHRCQPNRQTSLDLERSLTAGA